MEDFKDAEARKNIKRKNPFESANIISKICFAWMLPLFVKGYSRDLLEDDLFPHLSSHDSTYLGNKLENEWFEELNKKKPSLWKSLTRVFRKQFFVLGCFYFFNELFIKLAEPLFLAKLLDYFEPNSIMPKTSAFYYATAIALCSLITQVFQHTFMLHNFHLGMKIRVATSALVYRKALKLNKSALAETTVGQMVNLISNDVGRFELATIHIHDLWMAPLEITIVLILIYFNVGISGMSGVVVLLLFIPFQMWLGKKISEYRLATALRTDERIRLMNEIISGIQVIKMYTWEKPFAKLVEISRRREIAQIRKISIIRGILMSFNIFLNRTAIYVCVLLYVFSGNTLNAQYVFVLQSLYGVIRKSLTMYFPQGIAEIAEANISVKRIQKFLLYTEVDFDSSPTFFNTLQIDHKDDLIKIEKNGTSNNVDGHLNEPLGINIKNASFKWLKSQMENTLDDITMNVKIGQLAAIIGPVGSGKTTLLHAILGELSPQQGFIKVTGRLTYASQEPWIFVGSVKQNIIFGQKFDSKRYKKVIQVCQLERDFALFPHGDRTVVGERGVSLSGGQRARINLARAVYKDADIYLLDDPLSAVDAHVGKKMFEECIIGYLRNKCVVLVTHQLQYLKNLENIYLFGHGKIDQSGSYDQFENAGTGFTQLLHEIVDKETDGVISGETSFTLERKNNKKIRPASSFIIDKELIPKEESDKDPKFEKETRISGIVSWNIYKTYYRAGGHWCKIITLFIIFFTSQGLASFSDYFLTIWVNMNQIAESPLESYNAKNTILKVNDSSFSNYAENNFSRNTPLIIIEPNNYTYFQDFWLHSLNKSILLIFYSIIVLLLITLTIGRSLAFYRFCNKASIRLHNNMFNKIVYATMKFFNTNPSGRILNRFSKDMNLVDERLPLTLLDTLQISLNVFFISIVIASVNYWMALATIIMLVIFYFIRVIFLATSRDIKRLEGITRSPIYSHLTASLQGLTTIRAFGAQDILREEFDNYQNSYSSAYFMFLAANRTFGFYLDMHCVAFISLVTFSFLFTENKTVGGNVGLGITQATQLIGMFQWGMRQWSELENSMTSVERIKEYADVTPERENINNKYKSAEDINAKNWPTKGVVEFDKLSMRYTENEPCVLKDLSFHVKSTEKVGIVGRTGAGKSSLIMALFRLAYNEGRILIDNVDISQISLTKLRNSVSIIPQEPVLFSGTLRKNLDPFDEYADDILWNALDEVELKSAVMELAQGLESKISEGGSNFSVGQRQLLCLARAIVRKNKILVLDEATANVDPQTDALIQTTIRTKFSECTVLTVAHRLHTIMDSDKVLVMDAGRMVEFGHPFELLQLKENGVFYELVQQTGKAMADNLYSIAEENYQQSELEKKVI